MAAFRFRLPNPGWGLIACAVLLALAPGRARAWPPEDWDPVPPEELSDDSSHVEQGAGAEAIFWKVWISDGVGKKTFRQERDYYVRIKIYTAEGAQKYAKVSIDFPAKQVKIEDVRARTILPDGTVVPLERTAIVSENLLRVGQLAVHRLSFAPATLRPGCILEYRYRELRDGASVLVQAFELQLDLPVRKLLYYTQPLWAPGWDVRWMGFRTRARTWASSEPGFSEETKALHTRPYVDEPDSPPPLQQRAWMLRYYTQEPEFTPDVYWPAIGRLGAKWFDTYTEPGKETRALAQRIAASATSDTARVRLLGEWIQRDFRIVRKPDGDNDLNTEESARDVLQRNSGSVAEAGLVFASLARALGLTVRLLKVPTRTDFLFTHEMTDLNFLGSWKIALRLDGRWRDFHPATRYLAWDMVPWPEESKEALLCDPDSSRFIDTLPAGPDRSMTTRTASLRLAPDGTIEGELALEASGHLNEDFRQILEGETGGIPDSSLLRQAGIQGLGLEVTHSDVRIGKDEREPVRATCHVKLPEYATRTGKRLFFEPAMFHSRGSARFTASTRRNPIYFPYAWSELDSIRIRIPEGWKIESIESPEPAESPGVAGYQADLTFDSATREVVYRRDFRFGDHGVLLVPAENYGQVKHWFEMVHERDQATVTLVRDESSR